MTRQLGSILLAAALAATAACGDDDSDDKDASEEPSTGACGDGTVDEGEKCDDGNKVSGDGCSSSCTKETGSDAGRNDAGAVDAGSRDAAAERDSGAGELDSGRHDSGTSMDGGGTGPKPDAGGDTAADAGGGAGDAGSVTTDAGSVTMDSGSEPPLADLCTEEPADECERCSCSSCEAQMTACREVEGTAAAGPGAGKTKSDLCQAVVRCGQENNCRGTQCFCGISDDPNLLIECLTGAGPMGPCKAEIFAAAETDDKQMVATRQSDQNFALAFANAVSTCSTNSCAQACGQ